MTIETPPFTVGVEEEYLLVDPKTRDLVVEPPDELLRDCERAVPPEILDDMRTRQTFSSPVRIALAAVEQDPGLQCRLFALLPAEQMQEEEDKAHEPWAESVPKFEDTGTDGEMDDAEDAVVPILLGHIVRFTKDRKHPEDLAAEAADVLQTIIADDQPLSNVVDKLLDDL